MKAGIVVEDIAPKEMVAMKVDMGIPWEKVKNAQLGKKNFLHYLFYQVTYVQFFSAT